MLSAVRSHLFPTQGERIELTLWGSPTGSRYRLLYRELAVYASAAFVRVAHAHHGFSEAGDLVSYRCAELIEAATDLGARGRAVGWFVAHGRDGLMAPRLLARQIGVDPEAFEGLYAARIGRASVETQLRAGCDRGLPDGLAITVDGSLYEGREQGDALVAWACGLRRTRALSGRHHREAPAPN